MTTYRNLILNHRFGIGDRVQAGKGEAHDHGTVHGLMLDGYMVGWRSGVQTFLPLADAEPEQADCAECARIAEAQ